MGPGFPQTGVRRVDRVCMGRRRRGPARVAAAAALVAAAQLVAPGVTGVAAAGTLDFGGGVPPAIDGFTTVQLQGVPQLTSLSVAPFSIVDDTGSGAGWHVTLTIPDLTDGGSIIPASLLTMAAPAVTAIAGSDPTNVAGHASAGNFGSGEKIVTASAGNGSGAYLVSPQPVLLTVPVAARAGAYTSAASIAVVSGP
jgi:hypothetical protein